MRPKIERHKNNYCPVCDEFFFHSVILRHDTSNKPVEQIIYPEYCGICGHPLESKGYCANPASAFGKD